MRWIVVGLSSVLAQFCPTLLPGNIAVNAMKGNRTAYLTMTMLPEVPIIAVRTYVIAFRISPLVAVDKRSEGELGDEDGKSWNEGSLSQLECPHSISKVVHLMMFGFMVVILKLEVFSNDSPGIATSLGIFRKMNALNPYCGTV